MAQNAVAANIIRVFNADDRLHYRLKPAERARLEEVWNLLKEDSFVLMKEMDQIPVDVSLDDYNGQYCKTYLETVDKAAYAYGEDTVNPGWRICSMATHSRTLATRVLESIPENMRRGFDYQMICGENYISPFMPDLPLHFAQIMTVMKGKVSYCNVNVRFALNNHHFMCCSVRTRNYGFCNYIHV
jgi:hypothetical protein